MLHHERAKKRQRHYRKNYEAEGQEADVPNDDYISVYL
jgi:hypothetical protein